MNAVAIVSLVGALIGFAAVVWLIVYSTRGDTARSSEERAREFFDEHGYWPADR